MPAPPLELQENTDSTKKAPSKSLPREMGSQKRRTVVWSILLCVGYPLAIILPYFLSFEVNKVPLNTVVPFEFVNGLVSTSGILFGFSSLILISKDWIDKRVWIVIIPPLVLLIMSGIYIGNLALGLANPVQVLVLCSATFNSNVVSTGFIVGYVVQKMPYRRASPIQVVPRICSDDTQRIEVP